MSQEENKKNIFSEKETPSYALLGQYVPVHKYNGSPVKNTTVPISSDIPKFCIYDGDYLEKKQISTNDLFGSTNGSILKVLKYFFLKLPIISFFFLKEKQAKIKESISTLDSINSDVDKLVSFFEGKSVINDKKYRKICEELIKANNIQSKITKEILEDF